MTTTRTVEKAVLAVEQAEGVGARVRRSIGSSHLRNLNPFLMLDHFTIGKGAGFADHPHRGQATVTYMLKGSSGHEDFTGRSGTLQPGDLQWMQAGRGIVHAEMPVHGPGLPDPEGLQLWIDLPAAHKMDPPDYQEMPSKDIPVAHPTEDVSIKVIAGKAQGKAAEGLLQSPVKSHGGCEYYDIRLTRKGATVFQPLPANWTAFSYTLSGSVSVGDSKPQPAFYTIILSNKAGQDGVEITSMSDEEARLVLIAGEPLDQEIVQYGPFVLTNEKDVRQAFMDYRMGVNGFERATTWKSKIGAPLMNH